MATKRVDMNPPVSFQHIVRRDPNFSILIVKINPPIRVLQCTPRGGPDPDGDGPGVFGSCHRFL